MSIALFRALRVTGGGKYRYPFRRDEKYPGGILFRQTEEAVFALSGLTEKQAKDNKTNLKRFLEMNSPVDTGRLLSSWVVLALELGRGFGWSLSFFNRVPYFLFPDNYYRKKRRDFVLRAVNDLMSRMKPGAAPTVKPKRPLLPLLPSIIKKKKEKE